MCKKTHMNVAKPFSYFPKQKQTITNVVHETKVNSSMELRTAREATC